MCLLCLDTLIYVDIEEEILEKNRLYLEFQYVIKYECRSVHETLAHVMNQ